MRAKPVTSMIVSLARQLERVDRQLSAPDPSRANHGYALPELELETRVQVGAEDKDKVDLKLTFAAVPLEPEPWALSVEVTRHPQPIGEQAKVRVDDLELRLRLREISGGKLVDGARVRALLADEELGPDLAPLCPERGHGFAGRGTVLAPGSVVTDAEGRATVMLSIGDAEPLDGRIPLLLHTTHAHAFILHRNGPSARRAYFSDALFDVNVFQ